MAVWQGLKGWVSALSGDHAGKAAETVLPPETRDAPPSDLRAAAAHLLGTEVCARKILMVADPSCQVLEHAGWLDEHTGGVEMCSGLGDAGQRAGHLVEDKIVLVGIDYFTDLDAAITALAQFRQDAPDLPVVMGSVTFSRLDLSCERALIADASIRLPVTRPQLAMALGAALSNHRHMRAQLLDRADQGSRIAGGPQNDPLAPVRLST